MMDAEDLNDGPRQLVRIQERSGTVVIQLDGGEVLEVAPDAVPADLPEVGGSLGSPLLTSLREAAARKLAARRLFELVDRRLTTRARLRRKLLEGGHPESAVDVVLAKAEAQGLISDRAFAEAFCRETLRSKPVGGFWLIGKLRKQGVAGDLANEVVRDAIDRDLERELALAAATKRWRRESSSDQRALARVQRFLASRGFPASVCGDAARATRPEEAAESD